MSQACRGCLGSCSEPTSSVAVVIEEGGIFGDVKNGLQKREKVLHFFFHESSNCNSRGRSPKRLIVGDWRRRYNTLKVTINEKKMRLDDLTRQLDICTRAYGNLSSKIEEARIVKAMELGEVKLVSTAFEPRRPVAPNKRRNVTVAGIVGLMVGVFMAFCLEFWQKSQAPTS